MQRRHVAAACAAVIALAACASDEAGSDDTTPPDITLTPVPTTSPPTTVEPDTTVAQSTSTTSTTTTTTIAATTTVAPATTAAPETTEPAPQGSLVLGDSGIGAASFGAEPEGVIAFVSTILGPPTGDTGYVDPFDIAPCGGLQIRFVSWGVLTLEFRDTSFVVQDRLHFSSYNYGVESSIGGEPVGLATDQGLTVGSRVIDLEAAYPNVRLLPEDDFLPAQFIINDNLRGLMTGLADDDTVTVITGGVPCGE